VKRRQLTPGQAARLDAIRRASHLLDSVARLPGTSIRFGLDPILGLIPGLGDLISPLFSIAVLWQSRDLGLPRVVQLRMLLNVAIDALVGSIPLVGDLFDFAWKANDMNLVLLERYAYEERPAAPGDWLFVAVVMLLMLVTAIVPFLIAGWLISLVVGVFQAH
jgi:hypothetical protein